jgi:hypothetical protein
MIAVLNGHVKQGIAVLPGLLVKGRKFQDRLGRFLEEAAWMADFCLVKTS